jgi:hypothetical protein
MPEVVDLAELQQKHKGRSVGRTSEGAIRSKKNRTFQNCSEETRRVRG